jgi:LDH2 family malate/lactate/ureidoglycolate dehydrogenase
MTNADLTARTRTSAEDEHRFIREALGTIGVPGADARDVADVLLAADLRGIESHGIARLKHFYVDRIREGAIAPACALTVVRERPATLALDGGNGLGHPISKRAMARTIEKAREHGVCFTTVRNSNHFGIAGYYAMMALEHDLIGIASTDSIHYAAPTYGRDKQLGTNPFAFAIPSGSEPPFVLDFATTTVTFGKIEVYARMGKRLLPGWAVDPDGAPTDDPAQAAPGGALLPLGGFGTATGGHKGYGLGALCEILCGVLAGGAFGARLTTGGITAGDGLAGHFFGALRVDAIRSLDAFKADMDRELRAFRTAAPAAAADRVQVAGDPERENEEAFRRGGVPHLPAVWSVLDELAAEVGIAPLLRR